MRVRRSATPNGLYLPDRRVNTPVSLRILVADGNPDGLCVVERSNWIGKALVFPRALLPRVKPRDGRGQTGVHQHLGPRESRPLTLAACNPF